MANARLIKQRRAWKTRRLILSVARAKLLQHGLGLTCNEVVRSLNQISVSKGTLYYHFGSWEDLKKQVVEQIIKKSPELAELQATIDQYAGDPKTRLLIENALQKSRYNGRRKKRG